VDLSGVSLSATVLLCSLFLASDNGRLVRSETPAGDLLDDSWNLSER